MFRFFPWWKPNRTQPRSAKPRPYRRRPEVESLEDRVVPATFHVSLGGSDGNTGGPTDPFRMIQTALNAAAATSDGNDVIKVEAGTYNMAGVDLGLSVPGSANLDNLQLLGGFDLGMGFTTRTPRSTIYIPQTPGDRNIQDVNVVDPNVTIDGFYFVFDGNGVGGTGGTRQSGGVLSNTTGFVFNDNAIEVGLGRSPATTGARSLGVASTSTDQTGLTITNNTIMADAGATANFNDYGHGIFLNPDPVRTTDAVISGNLITGTTLANGIVIDTTGRVSITGNTILRTGPGSAFNLALIGLRARSVATPLSNVTISGNTLDSAGRTSSIALHFADAGGTQDISGVLVEKNLIQNNTTGVVIGPGANQNNDISATINYNAFTGNTTALFRSTLAAGTTSIDASRNWWDHVSGPTTAANPGGLGQAINDTTGIAFRPWLVYSPDNDPLTPGVQLPTTVNILAGDDVSAAENDFTLLQNAVGAVAAGQTLNLSGDFNWTSTFAAVEYNASTNTSATADIRGVELPGGVDNVTITSTLSDAHILGIGDSTDSLFNSFLFAEDGPSVGNTNFVLEKLNIDDFENAVIFGWNGTGTFTGTKIRDNLITIGGDDGDISDLQNIAIYFAAGTNQQITGNTVTFQGDGIRNVGSGARSFGFQNNTTGGALYDNLLIDNNTFQLASTSTGVEINHGIWENGHNDDNSADIGITNNRFLGRTGVDDFDRALFLTSQTDGLVIDGNTFTDVDNVLFSRNAAGGVEAGDEFTFTNNVLTRVGGADGVFLRNVTDDATPITVVVHWNINNTIDGFTGVRGLNELAVSAARPASAATDINAVIGEGAKAAVFVDDGFSGAARFADPDGIGSGVGPAAFGFNAFSSIQAGIGGVDVGGTVNVAAGTYAENVLVTKSVNLLGPNAGINPNTGVRGAEAIVVPAVTETSLQSSTSGTIFRLGTMAGHIDVTIDGFLIDGHNASLTGGRMLNGVEVHTGAGIINSVGSFDTNPGGHDVTMTVHNNIIQNLERYGVLGDNIASRAPRAGSDVSFNKIDNLPSGNNFGGGRGRGVAYEENFYGSVTHNVITRVNVGWQNDNYNLASPGAGTLVDNNEIHTYHRGIFHNLQYQSATPATISNNRIFVETDGDFAASTTNFGIELASIQDAVGATVTNNNVTGTVHGILLWNLPSTGTITVSGGTLTSNAFGILATNFDPQFLGVSASTSAQISGVSIVNATSAGIKVEDHPDMAATGLVSLTVKDDTSVSGAPTGILISGTAASVTIQDNDNSISGNVIGIDIDAGSAAVANNHIFNNTTGVRATNGGTLTAFANNDLDDTLDNGTDLRIDATAGSVTVGTGNSFGGDTFYIDNQSSQNITATGNTFDEASNFRIEDKMSHEIDNSAQGLVTWVADNIYITTPGMSSTDSTIQRGIDAASMGFTVNVEAGTYAENLSIPTAITLKGAQAGNDADTRFAAFVGGANGPKADPAVETVLTTPSNNPTGGNPNANDLIRVLTNSITIDGLVLDGNNPSLGASSVIAEGVNLHARRAITNIGADNSFNPVSNLTIRNNVVQNVADRGISLSNNGPVSTGNLITGNVVRNFGDPSVGGLGILLGTNAYTDITDNTIDVGINGIGLFLSNFFSDGTMTWSGNNITVGQDAFGIHANLFYAANAVLNISSNTVNAATGVTGTSDFTWGINVWSVQNGSTVNITNNTVGSSGGQFARGVNVWNAPTSVPVTISGGTIGNSVVGIDVESVDIFFGAGAATTVAIENVAITGSTVGVQVRAVPQTPFSGSGTPTASVTANLSGVSVSGATTGVLVEGFNSTVTATASVFRSTLTSNSTGVQINANGILSATSENFITGNTVGVSVASGAGSVALSGNNLSGNTNHAVNNLSSGTVNASGNFFGTNTPTGVAATVSSNVDYTPWLDVGTDTATMTAGFQGDFSVLHVDDSSPQSGATGRIQEGINLVTGAPVTVLVEAGTYDENVAANKMNLILQGATGSAADVIIDPTSGNGITVSANNVTIRDLRITGANFGLVASNVTPLTLKNLLIDGNTAGGSLTNVASVDFTASSGADTISADGDDFSATGVQSIAYSSVTTLALRGDAGDDSFSITPASTTAINVFGDAPTPMASPGDSLSVSLAGTTNPFLSSTSGVSGSMGSFTFDDRTAVGFEGIETLGNTVDVSITKTDGATTEVPGTSVTYTIVVSNLGALGLGGVAVSDMFPAELLDVMYSSVAAGGASGNTASGMDDIADTVALPVGSSITYTVTATISAAATGTLSNTATATVPTGVTDSDTGNNSATDTDTLAPEVDLVVSKTESIDPVIAGSGTGNLTYVITVMNAGPSDASGVILSEDLTLPAGVSVVSVTPSVGTFNVTTSPDGTWTVGNLASGASATLEVVLTVGASTANLATISNTATVTAASETLINTGDDSASESTTVARQVDLRVSKTESSDPVIAGSGTGNLTYVITVMNAGPSDASGVILSEDLTLPAGVSVVSVTPSVGTFNVTTSPDGTWTVGNLASGASATLEVVLTVGASTANLATISDTATVTAANETLINTGDDFDSESTTVARQVNLQVSMAESGDPVNPGSGVGNLTYVVTVVNAGPSDATGIVLSEDLTLPAGVSIVSVTPSVGSYTPTVSPDGTWMLGGLTSGASATLTIVLTVSAGTPSGALISSTATVTASTETRINTADDTATQTTTAAQPVDLKVNMRKSTSAVNVGQTMKFKIIVTNFGPTAATNIRITDVLPAGLTFVSSQPTLGGYDPLTGVWTIPTLAAGSKAFLKITVRANGTVLGQVSNTATLTGLDQQDFTPTNNMRTRKLHIVDVFRR